MAAQVNSVCRSCFQQFRHIRSIWRYNLFDTATTLLHSFFLNLLDCCNSIFLFLPKLKLHQLQSILKCTTHQWPQFTKFLSYLSILRDKLHYRGCKFRITLFDFTWLYLHHHPQESCLFFSSVKLLVVYSPTCGDFLVSQCHTSA